MVDVYTRDPALGQPAAQVAGQSDTDAPMRTLMNEFPSSFVGAGDNDWQTLQGTNVLVPLPFISVPRFAFLGGGPIIWRMAGSYTNTTGNNGTWNWQLLRDDGTNILPAPISMTGIPHDAANNGSFQGTFELWQFAHADRTPEQWLYYKLRVRANAATADVVFEDRVKCQQSFLSDVALHWTFQKGTVDGSVSFILLTAHHENPRSGA